jgi:hypothetical protein
VKQPPLSARPRGSGDPGTLFSPHWIPAFAGTSGWRQVKRDIAAVVDVGPAQIAPPGHGRQHFVGDRAGNGRHRRDEPGQMVRRGVPHAPRRRAAQWAGPPGDGLAQQRQFPDQFAQYRLEPRHGLAVARRNLARAPQASTIRSMGPCCRCRRRPSAALRGRSFLSLPAPSPTRVKLKTVGHGLSRITSPAKVLVGRRPRVIAHRGYVAPLPLARPPASPHRPCDRPARGSPPAASVNSMGATMAGVGT